MKLLAHIGADRGLQKRLVRVVVTHAKQFQRLVLEGLCPQPHLLMTLKTVQADHPASRTRPLKIARTNWGATVQTPVQLGEIAGMTRQTEGERPQHDPTPSDGERGCGF